MAQRALDERQIPRAGDTATEVSGNNCWSRILEMVGCLAAGVIPGLERSQLAPFAGAVSLDPEAANAARVSGLPEW